MFTHLTEDWIARRHAKHLSALRDGFITSLLRDLARQALPHFIVKPGRYEMIVAGYDLRLTITGPEISNKREISLEISRSGISLGALCWRGHHALPMKLPAGKPVRHAAAELVAAACGAATCDQIARRRAFTPTFAQGFAHALLRAAPEPLRDLPTLEAA